jgi:hypothetical protein
LSSVGKIQWKKKKFVVEEEGKYLTFDEHGFPLSEKKFKTYMDAYVEEFNLVEILLGFPTI